MNYRYAIFLLFLVPAQSFAQEIHVLKGKVIDGETHEPLIGAMIYNPEDIRINCLTDINGHFEFVSDKRLDYVVVNYSCALMDIWVEANWGINMRIEYGTRKAFRKSKRVQRKQRKMRNEQ